MKKLLTFFTAMAFIAFWAGLAMSGEYHKGSTLLCSECHTMHASQQHNFTDGTGSPQSWSPSPKLLKAGNANDLCLTCHNGNSAYPDVYGAQPTGVTYVRAAGALNKDGDTGNYAPFKGHTLNISATAPGGTGSYTTTSLTCAACHAVHGEQPNQYRNLWSNPKNQTNGTFTLTYGITGDNNFTTGIYAPWTETQIASNYQVSNIAYNHQSGAVQYGAWCGACHIDFHSNYTSSNYRHPTQGASNTIDLSYYEASGHTSRVPVAKNAASSYTAIPSCMSCHKAHGNQNAFGLIQMAYGASSITEEGSTLGKYEDLCRQCHNK